MDDFLTHLRAKHRLSVAKYPPELWAELEIHTMMFALLDEFDELEAALLNGIHEGDHSIFCEAVDVANVAMRIAIEMRRRAEAKCITR